MTQRYGDGRRILVTGGAGFVGSHLVDALLARGAEVVAVDNFVTGSKDNVAHLAEEDRFTLVDADVSRELPVEGRFDAVLHFASPASPTDFERFPLEIMHVHAEGTFACLDLAERDGARFVFAGTSEVYGDPQVHPQPESYWGNVNPIGPRSVYDEAKRFGEAATMAYRRSRGVDTAILRIFNTYGPRMRPDDGRAIPTFFSQALRGEPITVHGSGSQTRSICYVDDLVAGVLAMLDSDHAGPVNLGTEHEVSMRELAETIATLAGTGSEVVYVDRPTDDPEVRRPDLTLARELLGFDPVVGPAEGLRRTLAYFAERLGVRLP
ncbi:MAG TPA: UDP-glucuronic acid decarboxylase family protein [Cryptosporangiaceae bacterium]|nr:UDP-glucuronic acid decarboxylase family protein [Cryptosporangiaceae bacterium]